MGSKRQGAGVVGDRVMDYLGRPGYRSGQGAEPLDRVFGFPGLLGSVRYLGTYTKQVA